MRIEALNLFDHESLLLRGQRAGRRQGNPLTVDLVAYPEILVHRADMPAIGVAGLPMQGTEEASSLNIVTAQEGGERLRGITQKRSKPEHRLAARIDEHRAQARDRRQFLDVAVMDLALAADDGGHFFHLRQADGGLQVGEREVEANRFVDEGSLAVEAVVLEAIGGLSQPVIVGQ